MATIEQSLPPQAQVSRRLLRPLAVVAGIAVLTLMLWVWWSFFALRQSQTYEVLHATGRVSITPAVTLTDAANPADGLVIETAEDGYVTLSLGDGSILKLFPGSRAKVRRARSNVPGDRHETAVELDAGELSNRVPQGDGSERRVTVITKAVNIAVRGTVFTLMSDADASRLMVTRGKVAATGNEGSEVEVNQNMGTVIRAGEVPLNPVSLPRPPQPYSATSFINGDGLRFDFGAVESIELWQLEIALDEGFDKLLARHLSATTTADVPPLAADGRYFWRVASIDSLGLRGPFSAPQPFEHDYYYLKGRQALLNLNPTDAVAFIRNLNSDYEAERSLLSRRGWAMLRESKVSEAERSFETVLAIKADDNGARNGLGAVALMRRDLAAARAQFDAVTRGNPDNVDALVGLAVVSVREGKFADGLARSREALDISPKSVAALEVASMASVGIGDRLLAKNYVTEILAIDPDNATAVTLRQTLESADKVFRSLSEATGTVVEPAGTQ